MTQDIDVGKLSEQINDKADRDLWNTVPNVWNNTLNTSQITNCITEIPQDIKLELNDGVLTLKAGSKVYVPNGVGVFDVVTIASDISLSSFTYSGTFFVSTPQGAFGVGIQRVSDCGSGATVPSGFTGWFYNTTLNNIQYYSSGSPDGTKLAFPLAVISANGTQITSIDQVFNGFGYIGSTVFALPGVKGLIPNGRNADGSLKNIEFTTNNVQIFTTTDDLESQGYIYATLGQNHLNQTRDYAEVDTLPENPRKWATVYLKSENMQYRFNDTKWSRITDNIVFAITHRETSNPYPITSFTPKTAFHALDYNDKSVISSWSMPSNRYIDLTLGASGATYTAPANGWFYISKQHTAAQQYVYFENTSAAGIRQSLQASQTVGDLAIYIMAEQGQVVRLSYNAGGPTYNFRFIYAEGE